MISDSVTRVDIGAKLVTESGQTLQDIVESVKTVGDLVSMIETASREQIDGINQVNMAINQIDDSTQQNAALEEETNSAVREIASQAQHMQQSISFFKTG